MEPTYSKAAVLDFLRSSYIMSVATADQNVPSVSVLLYYVDDNLNFYFATHTDSTKAKNLMQNPKISLTVWQPGKMLVQANGSAFAMPHDETEMQIVDAIAASSAKGPDFWPPIFRIKGVGYVVFKVKPEAIKVLDLQTDTITQKDSPFTELKLD